MSNTKQKALINLPASEFTFRGVELTNIWGDDYTRYAVMLKPKGPGGSWKLMGNPEGIYLYPDLDTAKCVARQINCGVQDLNILHQGINVVVGNPRAPSPTVNHPVH